MFHLRDLESSDVARKGLVHRCSVLAVVVIHVPSEFFWSFLGRVGVLLSHFGLVVVYFGVGRLFLVIGGCLLSIWVVFLLQTSITAHVLMLFHLHLDLVPVLMPVSW